jgi:AraC family transcriptional regulator
MSAPEPLNNIDFFDPEEILPVVNPATTTSHNSGWKNIQIACYQLPPGEVPEGVSLQHVIALTSNSQSHNAKFFAEGSTYPLPFCNRQTKHVVVFPAYLPVSTRWDCHLETTHCYLDPLFVSQIAHESVNPDKVEINLTKSITSDPLIWQISTALTAVLQNAHQNSSFYADSMATALSAHLVQFYATRHHTLMEYKDGLPPFRLKRAIEYINAHLGEDLSLTVIAAEVGMSQYYFCRLFKQSMGIAPHKYITQQRVEQAKLLLKNPELRIIDITAECGFANPSHFAKCFRQCTGISPRQFREM